MKIDRNANLLPVENNQTVCNECSIRRLALFHGVPEHELDWTQGYRTDQYTIKARKEIYRESQVSEHMFTVYHGWFAVYKSLDNGKRQILRIALPGDMLGFQADMGGVMSHSAMSLCDSVVCAFLRDEIPDLLRKNLSVAKRLTELNARDMSICQSRLLTIGQQSAKERIAFFCTELFFRVKSIYNNKDDNHINFPISQEDIGDATGLTKIHVNRTLRALREEGLMEISGKMLKIYDIDAMCKLSNFNPASIKVHSLY